MTIKELFYAKATNLDKVILLFFYENKEQRNWWDRLVAHLEGERRIHFFSVDKNLHPELVKSFGVVHIPKLLVIFNGKEIRRYRQEEISQELITEILEALKNNDLIHGK